MFSTLGKKKTPAPSTRPKHSTRAKGGFIAASFQTLGIKNKEIVDCLVCWGNGSLTQSTWAKYGTATRHMEGAEKATGVKFAFPFTIV